MVFDIRLAKSSDAAEAAALLRASITQLCRADHRDDPQTLAQWLANKTPEEFLSWVKNDENFCVVAQSDRLVGVGLLHRSGEIRLCYVLPGMQGHGIGKAIMSSLEGKARQLGLRTLTLESTVNARSFYESLGYRTSGVAQPRFGIARCNSYAKNLAAEPGI
jgi:N-acetylglutamate synthase-like GNAT family acetyltransferase